MLEETRDTITVPASLMIRMLASLNQIRRGQNKAFFPSTFYMLFLRWWLEVRIHAKYLTNSRSGLWTFFSELASLQLLNGVF
jgi:hypothetical protein